MARAAAGLAQLPGGRGMGEEEAEVAAGPATGGYSLAEAVQFLHGRNHADGTPLT